MDRRFFLKSTAATAACLSVFTLPADTGLRMYKDGVFLLSHDVNPEPYNEDDGRWHSMICIKDLGWLDGHIEQHPDSAFMRPELAIVFNSSDLDAILNRGCAGFLFHKDYGLVRLGAVPYRMV